MKRVVASYTGFDSENAHDKLFSEINSQLANVERKFANYYHFDSVELTLNDILLSDTGGYDLFIDFKKNVIFDLEGHSCPLSAISPCEFYARIPLTAEQYESAKEQGVLDIDLTSMFPRRFQFTWYNTPLKEIIYRAYLFFYRGTIVDSVVDSLNDYFENYKFTVSVYYPERRAPGWIEVAIEGFEPYVTKVPYDAESIYTQGGEKVAKTCFNMLKKSIKSRYKRQVESLKKHENSLLDEQL